MIMPPKAMQSSKSAYGMDAPLATEVLLKMSGKKVEKEFVVKETKKETKTETKKSETYVSPKVEAIQLCMVPGESVMSPNNGKPEGYENSDDYHW